MDLLLAPGPARALARRGLEVRSRRQEGGTERSVAVALRLVISGQVEPTDLAVMAEGHDHPITAALLGGPSGQQWARTMLSRLTQTPEPAPLTAAARMSPRARMRRLSALLARIDADLRRDLTAAAATALAEALRRAGVKVINRGRRTKAAALALHRHADDIAAGRYPVALRAAVGVADHELLEHSFDAFGETASDLIANAQRRRRRALATTMRPANEDFDDGWDEPEEEHRDAGVGLLVAGLLSVAHERLADPVVAFAPEGEIPAVPTVPPSLISQSVRATNGAPVIPDGTLGRDVVAGPAVEDEPNPLIAEVVDVEVPAARIVQVWTHNDPARPFPPHEALDGWWSDDGGASWFDPAVGPESAVTKDFGEWPYENDTWFPQDHPGCDCAVDPGWDTE